MMHEPEKSDLCRSSEEAGEQSWATGGGAGGAKGRGQGERGSSTARAGRRAGKACPRGWTVYGKPQGNRKKERFTALFHHVDVDLLREAFFWLKREAAPGVDGMTWQDYEADLDAQAQRICMTGFTEVPIGRCPRGDSTFRSRTGGSARWALRRWKTRSSSGRWWRC